MELDVIYVSIFLVGISAVEHYLRRFIIPVASWVVVLGIAYGCWGKYGGAYVNLGFRELILEPKWVLYVFLPLLIYDSSRKLRARELASVGVEAGLLATIGVLMSAGVMGCLFLLIVGQGFSGIRLADALLFGAIMAATDPVAVAAIFKSFKVPEKLKTLVEGESLLNDGTTIILYSLISLYLFKGAPVNVGGGLLSFLFSIGGAVVFGWGMGYLFGRLIRLWHALHDRFISGLLPLACVYLAFTVGEHYLGVSGVISVMVAAMTLTTSCYGKEDREEVWNQEFLDKFWDFLGEMANVVLFFILGAHIGAHFFDAVWIIVPGIVLAMLIARSMTVYVCCGISHRCGKRVPGAWMHVLNIGGLRGALSVALILLLPEDYVYRDLFLCGAFAMIVFTFVANTMFMQAYLKRVEL